MWKKVGYSSIDEFMKVQSTWNRAGLFVFIINIVVLVLYVILMVGLTASIGAGY